jgi:hypothetical protein
MLDMNKLGAGDFLVAYFSNSELFGHMLNYKLPRIEIIKEIQSKIFTTLHSHVSIQSFEIFLQSKYLTEDILIENPKYIRLFGEEGNNEMALKFIESDKFTYNILKTPNKYGTNCVQFAFSYRSIEVILKILCSGLLDSTIITQLDANGDNLLEYLYLIENKPRPISEVKQILEHPKIKPHVIDLLVPNMCYICNEHLDMFLYLITFEGVTTKHLECDDGWTPLTSCASVHPAEIINLLNLDIIDHDYMSTQSDPDEEAEFSKFFNISHIMKKGGHTFLHVLAYISPEIFCKVVLHPKVQHMLHIKDNSGNTCFDFFALSVDNSNANCKICYESNKLVSLNCGHICCEKCAKFLEVCHICRKIVEEYIRIYF